MQRAIASLLLPMLPGVALASGVPTGQPLEEIVVTGTSIRGVAPAGGQSIGLDAEDITATGATSTVQLL